MRVLRAVRCLLFHASTYEEWDSSRSGGVVTQRLTRRECGICGRRLRGSPR